MNFELIRRKADKVKGDSVEQIKEDKHLVKIGSIHPQKGHRIFKVEHGKPVEVEDSDFIERLAIIHWINSDGSYKAVFNIKMKKAMYVSALNSRNAQKQISRILPHLN